MSIELPVATRHRRDMTEKLLKATLNLNTHTHHPSIHPSILCRNILVPKCLGIETSRGVSRDLVPNRLDAETSGAPGLGQKSLVTKTT